MRVVTYSLSVDGPPQTTDYHEQLFSSVKSLRAYNRVVAIHVFLYGEHPSEFVLGLENEGVTIHHMGAYADAVQRIRPRAFRTLARYPLLHKWMNFHKLAALQPSQVLQVDCDTFFFDDVEILFDRTPSVITTVEKNRRPGRVRMDTTRTTSTRTSCLRLRNAKTRQQ